MADSIILYLSALESYRLDEEKAIQLIRRYQFQIKSDLNRILNRFPEDHFIGKLIRDNIDNDN